MSNPMERMGIWKGPSGEDENVLGKKVEKLGVFGSGGKLGKIL